MDTGELFNALMRHDRNTPGPVLEGHSTRILLGMAGLFRNGHFDQFERVNLSQLGRDVGGLQREVVRQGVKRLVEREIIEIETRKTGRPMNYVRLHESFIKATNLDLENE